MEIPQVRGEIRRAAELSRDLVDLRHAHRERAREEVLESLLHVLRKGSADGPEREDEGESRPGPPLRSEIVAMGEARGGPMVLAQRLVSDDEKRVGLRPGAAQVGPW